MHHLLPAPCRSIVGVWIVVMALLGLAAVPADATPAYALLHQFGDNPVTNDGTGPQAALIQGTDGNFYGTTSGGGIASQGTVFETTPAGVVTILHQFGDGTVANDGITPYAALIQGTDGNFYGTTLYGGSANKGTVFKMTPVGTLTILHQFGDGTVANDGAHPYGSLLQGTDGNFYGTTANGGSSGTGMAFKMTPTGTVTIIHSFQDGTVADDGQYPEAALTQGTDGNFYGTTTNGGSIGYGTAFKMTSAGTLTILHSFDDGTVANDGVNPSTPLIQGTDGNFYGTTQQGGSSSFGTVFKMTSAGAVTILYSFGDGSVTNVGAFPYSALVQGTDGNFYGAASGGGAAGASSGVAFMMTPAGAVTILHSFSDGTVANDGINPYGALVQGTDGNFYGTTQYGGSANKGTVFKMTSAGGETVLHQFGSDSITNDGQHPQAALIQGTDGNFYGTTSIGGSAGEGTAFQMTPAGVVTILHSFGDGSVANDSQEPEAALIQGTDGNFYGTTQSGGSAGEGTAFQMTPAGVVTILHSFNDGTVTNDGISPEAALVQGADGNFYGTTSIGGSAGDGTVFQMTPAGVVTILHSFGDGSVAYDGQEPEASLIQSADGNFYGTTYSGGSANEGTVFKITPAGVETVLHQFQAEGVLYDGEAPSDALIVGADGNFYGTTQFGGSEDAGTVFQMTPGGTVTILHSFNDGTVAHDGAYPDGVLLQGTDGNFYGTTQSGGSAGQGTVFEMTPGGVVTILHQFNDGTVANDGQNPNAALIVGADGNFYGTTSLGGGAGDGTVFSLTGPIAPALTWSAGDIAALPDGTSRVLWTRSDGAVDVRSFDATGAPVAVGTTYGPFTDTQGAWTAKAVAVAEDGTARVLWTRADGAAGLWTLDAAGTETAIGAAYGPFTDGGAWTAVDLATAPNGQSRILWNRSDTATGLWTMNADDAVTFIGNIFGPFPGWTAKAVGAAADGTARILWTNANGAAGLWALNAANTGATVGAAYGPFTGSGGLWRAASLGTSADGTSQVLWTRADGAAGLWTFDAADHAATIGSVYGPFAGLTAAASDAAGDQSRVLWVRSDRAVSLWDFGTGDTESVMGSIYGPY